ncbi:MAG: hypothetical protein ACTSR1_00605 [Candidatus Heimdallarchaeota archaeon]
MKHETVRFFIMSSFKYYNSNLNEDPSKIIEHILRYNLMLSKANLLDIFNEIKELDVSKHKFKYELNELRDWLKIKITWDSE